MRTGQAETSRWGDGAEDEAIQSRGRERVVAPVDQDCKHPCNLQDDEAPRQLPGPLRAIPWMTRAQQDGGGTTL